MLISKVICVTAIRKGQNYFLKHTYIFVNALNRMLSFIIRVVIDWYTKKGQYRTVISGIPTLALVVSRTVKIVKY